MQGHQRRWQRLVHQGVEHVEAALVRLAPHARHAAHRHWKRSADHAVLGDRAGAHHLAGTTCLARSESNGAFWHHLGKIHTPRCVAEYQLQTTVHIQEALNHDAPG